jgi:ribose transport system ATP-binding protein
VGFAIAAGEVVGLLGANGAGKSTLVKILCGVYGRDSGEIRLSGAPAHIADPQDAIAAGIRLIPQEVSIHPDLSVAENISIADLPVVRHLGVAVVDRRRLRQRATDLLTRLGLGGIDPERRAGSLSLPQQRVVEIARAIAGEARVLVMDEPTAALAEAEAETLYGVVGALARQGVAVIYISHYLDEVFRLTDRMVVLRDGIVAGDFRTDAVSRDEVLNAMLASRPGELYPQKAVSGPGVPLFRVRGLTLPGALEGASIDVAAGEVVGIFGLIGSGVERVGRALFGAEKRATACEMVLGGHTISLTDPGASVRAGIGFVAAERKREGLIGIMSVRANTTLPFLDRFVRGVEVDRAAESRATQHWISALGIRAGGPEQEIRLLSGGNQQKVCLARWMMGNMRLLILEEPTRGVDIGGRREIYLQIRRLAQQGLGVVVVSTDAEEVTGLADRALVLHYGRVVAELGAEAVATDLLAASSSLPAKEAPSA